MSARDLPPTPSQGDYLRTEFLERVSHELRGPMGVSSGALDEIELALGPQAEALQAHLLMARRGLRRVVRVAERLHRTAMLEGGTVEWTQIPTDLRELTEEAVKATELLECRRGVRLTASLTEAACPVLVDREWMHAAIAELVGNAIRFARSEVSVHVGALGEEAIVTIVDDGPGFTRPPGLRFEPLADQRGVGLSLPLVFDVVAGHGGRVEIDGSRRLGANAASGAQVVLLLPLRPSSTS